jgi:ribosomal protein S18 acetylase RimI-like enzyme
VHVAIREYGPPDEEPVLELSLRAWAPIFASLEAVLGRELSARLHGEWREHQAGAVRGVLADPAMRTWVAAAERCVIGFVAARLHPERGLGEIAMLAVDPGAQRQGVGSPLIEAILARAAAERRAP